MRRINWLGGVAIALTSLCLAAVSATAAPARLAPPRAPAATSFTVNGVLAGVAATSARNAWAVGGTSTTQKTLLLHWNGKRWSQVTSPRPAYGALEAVAAVSADNAWAVGWTTPAPNSGDVKTLVMHWNGVRWSVQKGAPVLPGQLRGVAARGNGVWALGETDNGTEFDPLALHLTGNRWYVVPPDAPAGAGLQGIAVTGGNTAWTDGDILTANNTDFGLVMRWNGTVWKTVANPLQGAGNILWGLAAGPAGTMWAVGWNQSGNASPPTSMRWNGKTWHKVPVSGVSSGALFGVAFIPGGTAWAVGSSIAGALILRWTGHAWTPVANPDDETQFSEMVAVAATSAKNAWAVGFKDVGQTSDTQILHWNGRTWS